MKLFAASVSLTDPSEPKPLRTAKTAQKAHQGSLYLLDDPSLPEILRSSRHTSYEPVSRDGFECRGLPAVATFCSSLQ